MPDWIGSVAPGLAYGFLRTLVLAASAIGLSAALGIAIGLVGALPVKAFRWLVTAYCSVWRGLPLLITLFFLFFALPSVSISLNSITTAIIGLTLWGSANQAVLVRGAIDSIPTSQHEAARALGMPWAVRFWRVILPQCLRRVTPPAIGVSVILIQATAATSLIGFDESVFVARRDIGTLTVTEGETHAIPILGAVLIFFFVISYGLSRVGKYLEARLK